MISKKKIVLVIGSGASHDFEPEMGTGKDLIQNISDRVTDRTAKRDEKDKGNPFSGNEHLCVAGLVAY